MRAVWITGVGAVSSCGSGAAALYDGALTGAGRAVWVPGLTGQRGRALAACQALVDLPTGGRFRAVRGLPRVARLAALAAAEAWDESGLSPVVAEHAGVVVGSSRGGFEAVLEAAAAMIRGRVRPSLVSAGTHASLDGALAAMFGLRGMALTVSSACVSGASAMALAAEEIVSGRAVAMLAGGADAPLHPVVLGPMDAAGMLGSGDDPARWCRPFAEDRSGTVVGEGAGFVVLEEAGHARRRGARCLARLTGWATACEPGQRAGASADGAALDIVIHRALIRAGRLLADVGYVNAHGTGTSANDGVEAAALRRVWGDETPGVPVSSTKPVTGHCMGASPALEAIISVGVLRDGRIPPQGPVLPEPAAAGLRLARTGDTLGQPCVLSVSSGFWGHAGALVLEAAATDA
jgi:3-oxoacyl-[acyl-carrier-protein] synthase II